MSAAVGPYREVPLFDPAAVGPRPAAGTYPHAPGSKREGPSSEAARSLPLPKVREVHRRICALLEQHAMTPDELSASLGLKPAYGRPRCSELVALGLIEETGERRQNPGSRMSAGVYRRTPQPLPQEEQG